MRKVLLFYYEIYKVIRSINTMRMVTKSCNFTLNMFVDNER